MKLSVRYNENCQTLFYLQTASHRSGFGAGFGPRERQIDELTNRIEDLQDQINELKPVISRSMEEPR